MLDLSVFQRGQIAGVRMAVASVTKTTGVARSTVSKVMTAFEKEWKTSSVDQNNRRKRKLSYGDRHTLTQIVRKDHKNTALKFTAELNDYLENPAGSKTVRSGLHKAGFHRRPAIRKPR